MATRMLSEPKEGKPPIPCVQGKMLTVRSDNPPRPKIQSGIHLVSRFNDPLHYGDKDDRNRASFGVDCNYSREATAYNIPYELQ
jgi:hypothetical protein